MVKDIAEGFIRVLRSNLVSLFEIQSPVVKPCKYTYKVVLCTKRYVQDIIYTHT